VRLLQPILFKNLRALSVWICAPHTRRKLRMFRLPINLQFFAEEEVPESPSVEAGEETPDTGTAPESAETDTTSPEDVSKQESFAKRLKESTEKALAEERKKLEQEYSDKYKDYDVAKKSMEFLQRANKIDDPMTLKEKIELAELEEKAEQENLTVEELQRRQELDELKEWKKKTEEEQKQGEAYREFRTELEQFAKDNETDTDELQKFMYENQVGSFTTALKAMKADELQEQLANAEKEAVKKYLESKKAPKAEGSGAAGVVTQTPKTWEESRASAISRLKAANNSE
jgi:hypothetical protein